MSIPMHPGFPSLPPTLFRVGTTSYVFPADIVPNVKALAAAVDDVELLYLEPGDTSTLPPAADIRELAAIARAHELTYTIHLPIDPRMGSESAAEREASLTGFLRVINSARNLEPFGWIVHAEGIAPDASPERVARWQHDVLPFVTRLCSEIGEPDRLCLENIGYPFAWCSPFLESFPLSICTDAGHLWQNGHDWRLHVRKHLARTRVVHLYGTRSGATHYGLDSAPLPLVCDFLRSISGFSGVLTLETFNYDDTRTSMETLTLCLDEMTRNKSC